MPGKIAGHFYCSAHFLGELFAAENMEMQMLYRLASIGAAVCDYTVTAAQSLAFCDLGNDLKDPCDVRAVFRAYLIGR